MTEKEAYIADPCRVASLSFRKAQTVVIPENMRILLDGEPIPDGYADEPYFKLVHRLAGLDAPVLPAEFTAAEAETAVFAAHIRRCYPGTDVTKETLQTYREQIAADPGLWIAVKDKAGRTASSGIAEFDPTVGEGALEWIQTSPEYRRRGLGRYVVGELLKRLAARGAAFVTISGRMRDEAAYELYKGCGFSNCAIWHVLTRRKR